MMENLNFLRVKKRMDFEFLVMKILKQTFVLFDQDNLVLIDRIIAVVLELILDLKRFDYFNFDY